MNKSAEATRRRRLHRAISVVLCLLPAPVNLISLPLAGGGIEWKKSYEEALAQARKQGKLLVVHFWLEGRPLVISMNDETFSHPEVTRLSNAGFINVKIEIGSRPELFERMIGGRGGLATCVLDGKEDVVSVLPGYADPQNYVNFLKK